MRKQFAVALMAGILAWPALAADVGGVKIDNQATVGGKVLVLNGAGTRTRAIFKVYVGSLYLPEKVNTLDGVLAKGPRRIQLNITRTLSSDQLVDAMQTGLNDNVAASELAALKPQIGELFAALKAVGEVKENDIVTLDFVDDGTRIGFNGAAKATIAGDALNRALTKIWLGDNPVQADLKKAMLGG